jgi:acetolactate synthase-1/2/3 large subunit
MLGAEIIAKTLKSIGVKRVYLFPGGTIAPLLDALVKEGIDYICTINEQGAGYAAIGAAKVTGFPQVVMVTSGPGVTNVLTPVTDAFYDSVPLLVFTGQVGTKDINFDKKIRQTGFQETDTINIFKPVTKKSRILTLDEDISRTILDSFMLTKEGRQGPVLIDLPMDVQRGEIEQRVSNKFLKTEKKEVIPRDINNIFSEISELISKSKRPLILAGNGIYISDSVKEFRSFVEKYNIPVICSMPGVGTLPSNHPLCFSFIGHTGEYFANLAAYYSDLLIVFGARLDLRQTGTELEALKKNKLIVRVDIDNNELEFGRIRADININMDLKQFFTDFLSSAPEFPQNQYSEWIEEINIRKDKFHSSQFYQKPSLCMYDVIKAVDEVTRDKQVIVTSGVGGHQQMVARYFTFDYPRRKWLTSAGHGTMGFDLPTNIGAILNAEKNTLGIVFAGDGSFQMNIQELATIKEFELPIKIFVLDNKRLGIVSQFQLLNWDSDPSTGNKRTPSFSKIGNAYGLNGFDIYDKKEIPTVLKEVFADSSPAVVHCHVDYSEDVLPMLLASQKMNEMYPFEGDAV